MAKLAKLGTGAKSLKPQPFTGEMRSKLEGKSINDALEAKIITEVGDAAGAFVFNHGKDGVETKYAIFGNAYCRVSDAVVGVIDAMTDDEMGELIFYKNQSRKKYLNGEESTEDDAVFIETFTLGMPGGLNLGTAIKSVAVEVVA